MRTLFTRRRSGTVLPLPGAMLLLLVGMLCACGTSVAPVTNTQAPVTIGVSLSLTGDQASDGQATRDGYEVWLSGGTMIFQAVIQGILTGSIYALMASGLALTFGVLEIVNIAQGMFVVLGAYTSYALERHLHLDPFASLLLSMLALFAFGAGIEWVLLRCIRQERNTFSLLALFAVALVIEGALSLIFTPDAVQLSDWYVAATVPVGGFYLPVTYLLAFALSVVLLSALSLLLYRTTFGYSLRAVMQNATAAELIGIDVERVKIVTFGLGTALAAAGGVAFGVTNAFNPASSYDLIARLLVVVVLGGMGSPVGVLVASLLMPVIGDVTAVVLSPAWSDFVFFALLILVLAVRPRGIFGPRKGGQQ